MFSAGDKVFAKVRGYPAWPARVEAVVDATPNKSKYHVFFYGTLETAVCKAEDLYPYSENKENYGRPSKRKFFNEGLAQIEGLIPVPEPVRETISKAANNDSDTEGNLIIDENPSARYGKPVKRKRDSDGASEDAEEKPLQTTSSGSSIKRRRGSTQIQKRSKRDSLTMGIVNLDQKGGDSSATPKPEIVSRSGRKIKPKRFADDDSFDQLANQTEFENQNNETPNNDVVNSQQVEFPNELDSWKLGNNYSGRQSPAENYLETKEYLKEQNQQYKANTQSNAVSNTHKKHRNSVKYEILMKHVAERRKKKLAWLKIELRLMELEKLIRNRLRINKAEPEKCLELFDELHHLSIEPLMLKKHPEVVETINKIKRYTGHVSSQHISDKQRGEYITVCEKIRNKAKMIIDKFARLLEIPDGSDFKELFTKFVSELREKTKNLTKVKFYSLTVDPTVVDKDISNGVLKKIMGKKQNANNLNTMWDSYEEDEEQSNSV